jgi:hypothetical protein
MLALVDWRRTTGTRCLVFDLLRPRFFTQRILSLAMSPSLSTRSNQKLGRGFGPTAWRNSANMKRGTESRASKALGFLLNAGN